MIRTLVVVGAGLALAVPLAATGEEVLREQSEKIVAAGGLRVLEVHNPRGAVSVRRGADAAVRLTAYKIARGRDGRQARELATGAQVRVATEGDRLTVRVEYPRHRRIELGFWDLFSGVKIARVDVRLALEVPADLSILLRSGSGDLISDDLSGSQTLQTTSGDVEVGTARGPLIVATTSGDVSVGEMVRGQLSSASGDIQVDRAGGTLAVTTASGEIVVGEAADSLTVSCVSGDVRVAGVKRSLVLRTTSGKVSARASGRLSIEAGSGDVDVTLEPPLAKAEVTTVSGDMRVRLAAGLGCALDLSTSSGSIDMAVPLDMQSVSRQRVSGVLRRGSAPVVLRSSSGDIHVQN